MFFGGRNDKSATRVYRMKSELFYDIDRGGRWKRESIPSPIDTEPDFA